MDQLRQLGLHKGWIYEVVISTYSPDGPHATPIGVWTHDLATLQMDLYGGSRTLANILTRREFVADMPVDAQVMYTALHAPHALRFGRAREVDAPCLLGSSATLELTLIDTSRRTDRVRVTGRVTRVAAHGRPRLINRAEGLLVESLILVSRLERLDRAATFAALEENRCVVHRVAPGSEYAQAMDDLLKDLHAGS